MSQKAIVVTLALAAALVLMRTMPTLGQRSAAPAVPNLAGKIVTVAGPIDPSAAGETLMHEHIFIDFKAPPPMAPPPTSISVLKPAQPAPPADVAPAPGGRGGRGGGGLTDYDESLAEIMEFKKIGGGTIVDVMNFGLTRDPEALLRVSKASGLHVVMGAGWYQKSLHPPDMSERTVEELTAIVVRDVTVGAQGTSIRSGIIGEVGINGNPLIENELKSIRASARAARLTGAPMLLHSFAPPAEMMQALDIIASEGVDLTRVVMGHSGRDISVTKQFFDRGVYVEWDYMGQSGQMTPQRAAQIATTIASAVNAGFADKVLVAHDVCTKAQLKKNGGGGYTYIATMIVPALKAKGVSDETIKKILVDNPRRALTFVAPQPAVSQPTAAQQ
ncbi:MAG: phosphotriesterase family protein [Acidobacteriota bacterium]